MLTPPVLGLLRDSCQELAATLQGESAMALERVATLLTRALLEASYPPPSSGWDCIRADASPGTASASHSIEAVRAEQEWYGAFARRLAESMAEGRSRSAPAQALEPALDAARLTDFLRRECPGEHSVAVTGTSLASRGNSKRTVIVSLEGNRDLPSELALRIDQPFNYLGTRVADEYLPLKFLWENGVPVARPLALEPSGSVLGQPFLVSAKVEGAPIGSAFTFPERDDAIVHEFARAIARLHSVPVERFPVRPAHSDAARLDAELAHWRAEWRALERCSPTMDAAFAWIEAHRQFGVGPRSIVHGDCSLSNVLFRAARVTAILDWEFVHVGHPAVDLGYFYYAAQAVSGFDRFLAAYVEAGGARPEPAAIDFYILWGQLRLAIMTFQVESGLRRGELRDLRYVLPITRFLPIVLERVGTQLMDVLARYGAGGASSSPNDSVV